MKEEEEDKYDYKTLIFVILLYFPVAFMDSVDYYVNGTSLGYRLFSNGLFNPIWGFWGGLIGTMGEILLVYYLIRKKILFNWFNSWFKGKSNTRQSKIKGLTVFISYASEDLNRFKIPKIANYLESQPEIQKVYYWERDNNSSQRLVEYMEESILNSDIFIAISSQHSLTSAPVKKETEFADYNEKRIIPIYENIKNVRPFIRIHRAVEFKNNNFNEFLDNLKLIIKGDSSSVLPQRSNRESEIQILFEKLKILVTKLFNPNIETAYIFTSKLLRSEEMQDYFGISVREQDNLEDQNVYFIDGLYYIIPNSKTLRIRKESREIETILTRSNLTEITEEEIIIRLNKFFLDIVIYVREEYNIKIN